MIRFAIVFSTVVLLAMLGYNVSIGKERSNYIKYFESAFTQPSRLVPDKIVARHFNKADTLLLCVIIDSHESDIIVATLNQALSLFEEFTAKEFPEPKLVSDITFCDENTRIFFDTFPDKIDAKTFEHNANYIINLKKIPIKTTHNLSPWGNIIHFLESEHNIHSYISISLFSEAGENVKYRDGSIVSVALEELYQAITIGRDLPIEKTDPIKSILQERPAHPSAYTSDSKDLVESGFFLESNNKLCRWDLLNLHFLGLDMPKPLWKDFKKTIKNEFKTAEERAQRALSSGKYSLVLSDSC